MSVHTQNILTLDDTPSAPRTNRDEERAGLFVDALRLGGRIRLEVHGESMLPALWPADTVEIECCSMQDVQVGDIVLAQRDARMFLHRSALARHTAVCQNWKKRSDFSNLRWWAL